MTRAIAPGNVPDHLARTQALDIHTSCVVEAPAGSGKTGLLIQRFLKLLATVEEPEQVLALTFTRKATGEMRDRVLEALRHATEPLPDTARDFERETRELASAVLQRDAERSWHLQERSHLLNIRTFDSLCSSIARSAPLLSGGIATTHPVDDTEPLYQRAAHAAMLRMGGDDALLTHAITVLLRHRDGNLKECERALAEMLGTREQWGHLLPLGKELDDATLQEQVLPRLNASLRHAQCDALKRLHACFPEDELRRLATLAQSLALAEDYKGNPNEFASCAQLHSAPGTEPGDVDHWLVIARLLMTKGSEWRGSFQSRWLGVTVQKHQEEELGALLLGIQSDELLSMLRDVRNLPPAEYPPDQWIVAKALFRVLQQSLVELRLLFAQEGVCDFTEIALAARIALQSGELQAAFGTRLQHLLVDEMQDSSSGQYDLLETLTEGWDGWTQTIFLVGDPKQSIYLFRQARVERFQRCMAEGRLGDIDLKPLRLSANFRSGRNLVHQFNDVFQQVFPEDHAVEGDIVFSPADGVLPGSPRDRIVWHGWLLQPSEGTSRPQQRHAATQLEARTIADIVQQERHDRPTGSIAVLTRARTHVPELAKVFAERGIPYRAVDIDALGERREVLDILALTRALLHPADRTAWLAVLRAPWCGVGLADLHTLADGDRRDRRTAPLRLLMRSNADALQPAMRMRVLQTLDVMDAALSHTGVEPLAHRVERTWRSLGGDACTDAGGQRNVGQFLRVLDSMAASGEAVTLHTLERRLKRLFAEAATDPGAVDIMTIHKAKGLEWDVVLVPGMHRIGAQDGTVALNWLEMPPENPGDIADVLLAPLPGKGDTAAGLYGFIRRVRTQRTHAELKRLVYVAATRARSVLHVFASPDADTAGMPSLRAGTLLKATGMAAANFQFTAAEAAFPQEQPATLSLAASGEPSQTSTATPRATLERLRNGYDPLAVLQRSSLDLQLPPDPAPAHLPPRPQGSFGARAVGTAIHNFVERLAHELQGATPLTAASFHQLELALPSWLPAITAALRSGGLPAAEVVRATRTVERALGNLLTTPEGQWLLMPHAGAESESAWRSFDRDDLRRMRLDRSFYAGPRPFAAGEDTLWIVDFKTADRAEGQQDAFLQTEVQTYRGQLEEYGRMRAGTLPAGTRVMLALSYPLMKRLVYWPLHADGASTIVMPPAPTSDVAQQQAPQLSLFS